VPLYQPNFREALKSNRYFVKGDISGIQSFVFNIKSERAAKTLKARSFFVAALAAAAVRRIQALPGVLHTEEIFEGGGNFYLIAASTAPDFLETLQSDIQQAFRTEDLHLTLSVLPLEAAAEEENYGPLWKSLHEAAARDRLQHFQGDIGGFSPFNRKKNISQPEWAGLTNHIVAAADTQWQPAAGREIKIERNTLRILAQCLTLRSSEKGREQQALLYAMPRYTTALLQAYEAVVKKRVEISEKDDRPASGNLISFHYMAAFAKQRSGSDKLGVLKIDLDDLGKLFEQPGKLAEKKALSAHLKHFFGPYMAELLQKDTFQYLPMRSRRGQPTQIEPYAPHVYTVFAGGDDCFFIGGWDAIFEWALHLRKAFAAYLKEKQLPALTFSAGLIAVHDKFPVVRMAELVEDAIQEAKTHCEPGESLPTKNRINVLGETLTWEEYEKAARYADQLEHLIKAEGRSRNLINRLKNLAYGYDQLQRRVVKEGTLHFTAVSRMAFYLGKLRGESYRERKNEDLSSKKTINDILQDCQMALLTAGVKGKTLNPMVFPVAARWAELRCRGR